MRSAIIIGDWEIVRLWMGRMNCFSVLLLRFRERAIIVGYWWVICLSILYTVCISTCWTSQWDMLRIYETHWVLLYGECFYGIFFLYRAFLKVNSWKQVHANNSLYWLMVRFAMTYKPPSVCLSRRIWTGHPLLGSPTGWQWPSIDLNEEFGSHEGQVSMVMSSLPASIV